ncbi:MAG TPA: hypothetical protein VFG67_02330 [Oleiagrimonas sp.]|nr:hypothetical protein [Oleiagrimonas sp.]
MRIPDSLPRLGSSSLLACRVLWGALAIVVVLFMVFGTHRYYARYMSMGRATYGLGVRLGGTTLQAPTTSAAVAAGIRNGQIIVGVNGHPVEQTTEGSAHLWKRLERLREGDVVVIQTLDRKAFKQVPRGQHLAKADSHRLTFSEKNITASFTNSVFNLHGAVAVWTVSLLIATLMMAASSLLMMRNAGGNPVAILLALGFVAYPIVYWTNASGSPVVWLMGRYILEAANVAVVAGLLAFPEGRFRSRGSLALAILLPCYVVLAEATKGTGAPLNLIEANLHPVLLGALLLAVANLWLRPHRSSAPSERLQVKWARMGFAVGAVCMCAAWLVNTTVMVDPGPETAYSLMGYTTLLLLSACALSGGLLIALMRYRLYDAESVISRSAAYGALSLLLAGTFTAVTEIMKRLFEETAGHSATGLAGAVGAGIAVIAIVPLNNRIQAWAERYFQKDLLRLRQDVPRCVDDLRETASMQVLMRAALDRIATGIHTSRAIAVLAESDGPQLTATVGIDDTAAKDWIETWTPQQAAPALDCARSDHMFPIRLPLRVAHESRLPIGWIMLGPRPDGSLQAKDERQVLMELVDPIARAIRIVQLREAHERKIEARFAQLALRIDTLESTTRTTA